MGHMANGVHGQCGYRVAMGYRGMGHMGNEVHRGKWIKGVWGT